MAAGALGALVAGCSEDEGSAEELCATLREQPALESLFAELDPTDVEQALDLFRQGRDSLEELRDVAPSEVRDELTIELDYLEALVEAMEPMVGRDDADIVAALQEVNEEHPDVQAAAQTLEEYEAETCA